jgi:glycerophosphoryl diester phosphodiesterase
VPVHGGPGPGGIRVVAHRGSSDIWAEHTLDAYVQAIDEGADALEADVRLTADGHLVCVHDRRVDRTSNGRGALSTLPLSHLQTLDFASWKQDRDGVADSASQRRTRGGILTVEELIRLVLDAPRPLDLLLETKHPTRYAGLVEQALVALLERYGLTAVAPDRPRVHVMSFSEFALRRVRRMAPQIPLVFLMERVPLAYRAGQLPMDISVGGPSIDIVRAHPGYVRRLHERGHRTFVWTCDDAAEVDAAVAAGVDAIITNRPAFVLERLRASLAPDGDPSPG